MANQTSFFVIIDGIDGSGKNTLARGCLRLLESHGLRSFDVGAWSKEHRRLPGLDECGKAEVIFTTEPAHAWVGSAIREEMIRPGNHYTPRMVAQAFALDRLILYQRLILPLLERGKIIIQERGISASLVYQTHQPASYQLAELTRLPGNALALCHPPQLLVIAECAPETAMERLAARTAKQDDAIFERLETLRALHGYFHAPWFKNIWRYRSTSLRYLDTGGSLEETEQKAEALGKEILACTLRQAVIP
ncbi:hypothetical protein HY628_02855 [Candidatus Uhrbacteria bacterium]|nr:hypothetical protein [Candidatus Uhrbacteria bacterium]